MESKRWIRTFLCTLLCIGLMPALALAADRTPVLTVNGVDALTTPSGDGWSYDSKNQTLTLNGYNGGSIVATYMDLVVALAEGSTNVVSTTDEYGIAYSQASFTSPFYDLRIVGSEGSTLDIVATNHAVFSKGDLFIENCDLTAKNTTTSTLTGKMECISSEGDITIKNSTLNVTTATGVGITCYGSPSNAVERNTIEGSTITVNAGMIGIHVNNTYLTISDSNLDVTGGTAALFSYFSTVHLKNCKGSLAAQTAAIYAGNIDNKADTDLINCDLHFTAPYGVLTYSGIKIEDGNLGFDCSSMGIYAYSASYDAQAQVKGSAKITCSSTTPQLMQIRGTYSADETANVTGLILENTGDPSTTRILFVGNNTISSDIKYDINILIPKGSMLTVAPDVSLDLSSVSSVTIDGTLTNQGTLTLNGANTTNNQEIYNYHKIILADNQPIVNNGKIYSVCSSSFDLTPYPNNSILFHAPLNKVDAVPATHLTEGNIEYWFCSSCRKYFTDAAATQEILADDIVIPVDLDDHTFGEWTVTKEATETEQGARERTCTICGFKQTETMPVMEHVHVFASDWSSDESGHWHACACGQKADAAGHTFGDWTITKEATETEPGARERTCTVCGFKQSEIIPVTEHVHAFASDWSSDESGHWHACACGQKADAAGHTFIWITDKEASETEKGSKHEECSVCGYQKPAVEIPLVPVPSLPQTGDSSRLALWISLFVLAAAGIAGASIRVQKKGRRS